VSELRGLDRWLEREPGERDDAAPRMSSFVQCKHCGRQDESVNQRRCRRCGSSQIERFGGQRIARRKEP
jgi:hypothetical protein